MIYNLLYQKDPAVLEELGVKEPTLGLGDDSRFRRRTLESMAGRKLTEDEYEALENNEVLEQLKLPPAPSENSDNFDVYKNYELLAESRDDLKIYLTASLEERAKRREIQLKRLGTKVNMRILLDELEARDKKDIERKLSPLRPAKDSLAIDTTGLSPEEVLKKIKVLL